MKTNLPVNLFRAVLPLLLSAMLFTCKKSAADNFTWTHNGVTHTTSTNIAYISGGGLAYPPYSIVAGFPRSSTSITERVVFHLTAFDPGPYTITGSAGAPNRLTFIDDSGNALNGISGTLNITAHANNKLSGNFSTTVINAGSVTSQLTGNFTDVPVNP